MVLSVGTEPNNLWVEVVDGKEYPLPLLAYGTLRVGGGNEMLWQGKAFPYTGKFYVSGYVMVCHSSRWFPYAIPTGDPRDRIVVDVIQWNSAHEYRLGMALADQLEGYPLHYCREIVEIRNDSDSTFQGVGWLYTPSLEPRGEMLMVPDGDWIAYKGKHDATRQPQYRWV